MHVEMKANEPSSSFSFMTLNRVQFCGEYEENLCRPPTVAGVRRRVRSQYIREI